MSEMTHTQTQTGQYRWDPIVGICDDANGDAVLPSTSEVGEEGENIGVYCVVC